MAAMVALLEPRLRDPSTPPAEAAVAMQILLQLQADRAPCAADARPIELFPHCTGAAPAATPAAALLGACPGSARSLTGPGPAVHWEAPASSRAMHGWGPSWLLPRAPLAASMGVSMADTRCARLLQQAAAQADVQACLAAHQRALQDLVRRSTSDAVTASVRPPPPPRHACMCADAACLTARLPESAPGWSAVHGQQSAERRILPRLTLTLQGGPAALDRSVFKRMLGATSSESGEPSAESVAGSEAIWADLIVQLTAALQRSLPPFWQLSQVPGPGPWLLPACCQGMPQRGSLQPCRMSGLQAWCSRLIAATAVAVSWACQARAR